jgi:hypothetical protein
MTSWPSSREAISGEATPRISRVVHEILASLPPPAMIVRRASVKRDLSQSDPAISGSKATSELPPRLC